MGAGKTTVGAAVARLLGRPFVDTDDLVVAVTGRSVTETFGVEGEPAFRAYERAAVADACAAPDASVISCGGGAVLDPGSRRLISDAGFVVWLDAPGTVLAARVGQAGQRPLLGRGDAVATLERLRDVRSSAYEAVASTRVDTEGRSVDDVVDAVVEAYEHAPGGPR